jgi:DNA polymerase III subunit chi
VTEVAFHFGAPDKLAYACRLLRKAAASGARVIVVAEVSLAHALDQALWAIAPSAFIAHTGPQADAALRSRSAVALVTPEEPLPSGYGVIVNLDSAIPVGFETFARLIEVVSLDEADRQQARQRWKRYQQLGYDIIRHDLKLHPGS